MIPHPPAQDKPGFTLAPIFSGLNYPEKNRGKRCRKRYEVDFVVNPCEKPWTDRNGITFIGIVPFLLAPKSLETL